MSLVLLLLCDEVGVNNQGVVDAWKLVELDNL